MTCLPQKAGCPNMAGDCLLVQPLGSLLTRKLPLKLDAWASDNGAGVVAVLLFTWIKQNGQITLEQGRAPGVRQGFGLIHCIFDRP